MKPIVSFSPSIKLFSCLAIAFLFSPTLNLAQVGKIVGKITYGGKTPHLKSVNMREYPDCAAKHKTPISNQMLVLGDGNTLSNVLIRVKNPPKNIAVPIPRKPVMIDQNGCFFSPRVTAVQKGQPIQFKNSDGILHNVQGFPKVNKGFNIDMPPSATSNSLHFNQGEAPFPVKCDVHPWMNAYVAVMTHPYFAVTSENGSFEIKGLPPGTYDVEAWHEKLGTQSMKVTVGKQSAVANLSFK